jgi:hypothetical protein
VLPGRRLELQLGVVGRLLLVHFLEADLREAAEQAGRHRRPFASTTVAPAGAARPLPTSAIFPVRRARPRSRGCRRSRPCARARADQDVLCAGERGCERERRGDEEELPHSEKSERGFDAGCARS